MKLGVDHIGNCVTYMCHDGNGNFVMAKRNSNTTDEHDTWDTGGGKIEFGHDVIKTLKREIKEEYCAEVIEYEFLGYRDVHRIQNGNPTHWIALDFKVLVNPDQVKNGEPHKFSDIGWFTMDTLPENLHSQLPKWFDQYKDRL